jgi:hypothetical protein
MSITQTYYLAHTARGKLSSEAARADHNLRLLVGHANLLDSLMLELAEAEQEQESWFNQSVRGATKNDEQAAERHIKWADSIVEEPEEDWQAEDADSDSDSDSEYDSDSDIEMSSAGLVSLQRVQSSQNTSSPVSAVDESDPEYFEDDAEDYTLLSLVRTSSHSTQPPELSHDSEDDSSEDESMPPSPPSTVLPSFSEKQRQQIATSFYDASQPQSESESRDKLSPANQAAFFDEGFYLPPRSTTQLVSAISVY